MPKNLIEMLVTGKDTTKEMFKNVEHNLDSIGTNMQKVGTIAVGMGVAIGTAMVAMSNKTAEAADSFAKFERASGVSSETLAALQFAIQRWGGAASDIEMGLKKLSKAIVDADSGLETYKKTFDRMNISTRNAQGELKSVTEIMPEMMDWFQRTEGATLKLATAVELFGRPGLKMVPLLNQGAEGMKELTERAKRLGIIFSGDALQAGEDYQDAMLDIKQSVNGLTFALGVELLPVIKDVTNGITEHIISVREWIELNPELSKGIMGVTVALVGAGGLSVALGTILRLIKMIRTSSVISFGPQGAIVAAIVGGVVIAVSSYLDLLKDVGKELDDLIEKSEGLDAIKPIMLSTAQKEEIVNLRIEIEKVKKAAEDTTYMVLKPRVEGEPGDSIFKQIELNRDDYIANLEEQINSIFQDAKVTVKPKIDVDTEDEVKIDLSSLAFTPAGAIFTGPLKDEADKAVYNIMTGAIDQPELRQHMVATTSDLFGSMLGEAGLTISNTTGILAASFNNMFQKMLRDGKNATDLLKGFFQSMASGVVSVLANLAAKASIALLWSAFTPGSFVTAFSMLQGGGTVQYLQGGGTIGTGMLGKDTVPAMLGKRETVITHEITDKLEEFLDNAGDVGSRGNTYVAQINAGIYTGTEQTLIRGVDVLRRGEIDYERNNVSVGKI